MGFFDRLFGRRESERPKSLSRPNAGGTETTMQDHASVIRKRASAIGIPQNTVQDGIEHLSPDDLRLLAECADNFFMVYLWSPWGTQAKADAARDIGLRSWRATRGSGTTIASAEPVTAKARVATANEHYVLECISCDFTHHIPSRLADPPLDYSVDVDSVKLVCVYGGQFTVTLQVKDFFRIRPVPQSGRVLRASIGDNMKPIHSHMLSHCDPLYLIIQQSSNKTTHEYKNCPEGQNYVKFSKDHGTDIVGRIDVSKAEIPGVS